MNLKKLFKANREWENAIQNSALDPAIIKSYITTETMSTLEALSYHPFYGGMLFQLKLTLAVLISLGLPYLLIKGFNLFK